MGIKYKLDINAAHPSPLTPTPFKSNYLSYFQPQDSCLAIEPAELRFEVCAVVAVRRHGRYKFYFTITFV